MSSSAPAVTRPAGVGVALAIVALVYAPAGLGDVERVWAAAALLAVGFVLGEALGGISAGIGVPGVMPAGLLIVLSAMYLCVPETNQFVVAALIPIALLVVEVVRRDQLGLEWYALAAASVAWAGMFGAAGRQSALVGAIFAWWPILLPWLVRRSTAARSRTTVLASMVIGAVAAITFARTGGVSDSGSVAVLVVLLVAVVSGSGAWLVARRTLARPSAAG